MNDSLLVIPTTPAGTDPVTHYRTLLVQARSEITDVTWRLHVEPHECQRDEAAEISTALRELSRVVKDAIDAGLDDEVELTALLGLLSTLCDRAERVLMAADLRVAYEHDLDSWALLEPQALAIGDFAGSGFIGFVVNELTDRARFQRVEECAQVPLMHALMRSIGAGMLDAREVPLAGDELRYRLDELLFKLLEVHPPIAPDDPLRASRFAQVCAGALWNLSRIAQRDDMSPAERNAYLDTRREQLAAVRADTQLQQRELHQLPDYDYWYDVGLAYATIEPILARCAAEHGLTVPLRAEPGPWITVLGEPGDE